MSYRPNVDTLAARLHREGWSIGDVAVDYSNGRVWVVSGQRDGRRVVAEGQSQTAAWKQFADAALGKTANESGSP